ncbi:MAG: hypothetical protein JSS56_27345 [Proteobacteria bacterium]|nr:hypothetical protein [Pseudomonadota bacterium]
MTFTEKGATVAGAINAAADGSSGSASLNVSDLSTSSSRITGAYLNSGGAGAAVSVAAAGDGVYEVVGSYRAKTATGAGYIGVYRFACK